MAIYTSSQPFLIDLEQSTLPAEFRGVDAWLEAPLISGAGTYAGVQVTESRALTLPAVFACCRVIAEDVAKLPTILYKRVGVAGGTGKERAIDHGVYDLLKLSPNPEMGAFDFEQAMMLATLLWGNGFAEIVRNGNGEPVELWPIEPWRVRVDRDDDRGPIFYEVQGEVGEKPKTLRARDMLHIKGLTPNGFVGWALPRVGKEAVGMGIAAMDFTASYFANGASITGLLSAPGALKAEEFKTWVGNLRSQHEGSGNRHKFMALDQGATFTPMSADADSSQLIDTLNFSIEDVARYFRVTPHKIGHLLRATFNNIEHLDLDHYKSTLLPRLVQIEEELTRKLLRREERTEYVIEHLVDALLRADYKTRTEGYSRGLTDGWMNVNEVRAMENLNPIPGGDKYRVQQNLAVLDDEGMPMPVNDSGGDGPPDAGTVQAGEDDEREQVKARFMPWFADATARLIDRDTNAIAAKLGKGDVVAWAAKWYPVQAGYAESAVRAACGAMAEQIGSTRERGEAVARAFAERYVLDSLHQIKESDDHDALLSAWRTERAPELARQLTDEVCYG